MFITEHRWGGRILGSMRSSRPLGAPKQRAPLPLPGAAALASGQAPDPQQNQLLNALPEEDYRRLEAHLEPVQLKA